jgi:outer membrane protein OmpA-like peptidoglycan-associated protein
MLQVSRFFNRLTGALALAAVGLALAGCVSTSSLDLLDSTTPTGSPFTQALFRDYATLAKSFNITSDSDDLGIFGDSGSSIQTLAEAFATKALIAAKGTEVDPEPSFDDESAHARERLLHSLAEGKDRFPNDAARAQAEFDCWMLNMTVGSQQGAAAQCHAAFEGAIARLERDINPPPIAPPPSAPAANYTVYFNFNSWTLTGEQLTVLQQAIATARAGGQSHITIVGHTDTVGSDRYNERLSLKRANVVAETLVDMGARRDAIQVSGVGKADLAVQTPNGVREPKNRRSVVTLLP